MATVTYNTYTLAQSVRPGVEALVAQELESIVQQAIKEATDRVRKEVIAKVSKKIETSVQQVLSRDSIEVHVKCDVTVK